jgi:hypothetical protein
VRRGCCRRDGVVMAAEATAEVGTASGARSAEARVAAALAVRERGPPSSERPNWLRLGSPHMSDERGNLVVPPL